MEVKRLDRETALGLIEKLKQRSADALREAAVAKAQHRELTDEEKRERRRRELKRRDFLKEQARELSVTKEEREPDDDV